jgi:Zn-dependent membrane protease YugP
MSNPFTNLSEAKLQWNTRVHQIERFLRYVSDLEKRRQQIKDKYASINTSGGRTGAEIIRILNESEKLGISVVNKNNAQEDSSCYSPRKKCISLDRHKFENSDYLSVAIAAHEFGHAWFHSNYTKRYRKYFYGCPFLWGLSLLCPYAVLNFIFKHKLFKFISLPYSMIILSICIFICVKLQSISLGFNEKNEIKASRIGLRLLSKRRLINDDEIEGIKEILRRSFLSYRIGSYKSWQNFILVVIIYYILLLVMYFKFVGKIL